MKFMLGIIFTTGMLFGADNNSNSLATFPYEIQEKNIIDVIEKNLLAKKYKEYKVKAPKDYELLAIGKMSNGAYLIIDLITKNYRQSNTAALKVKLETVNELSEIRVSGIGIDANPIDNSLRIFASLWDRGDKKLFSYYRFNGQAKATLDQNYWIDLENPEIPDEARLELFDDN